MTDFRGIIGSTFAAWEEARVASSPCTRSEQAQWEGVGRSGAGRWEVSARHPAISAPSEGLSLLRAALNQQKLAVVSADSVRMPTGGLEVRWRMRGGRARL